MLKAKNQEKINKNRLQFTLLYVITLFLVGLAGYLAGSIPQGMGEGTLEKHRKLEKEIRELQKDLDEIEPVLMAFKEKDILVSSALDRGSYNNAYREIEKMEELRKTYKDLLDEVPQNSISGMPQTIRQMLSHVVEFRISLEGQVKKIEETTRDFKMEKDRVRNCKRDLDNCKAFNNK